MSKDKKVDKIRKPRVQITYDVQVGDAIEDREIPFVVGVMADLSGNASKEPKRNQFVEVKREDFQAVMRGVKPRLEFKVPNKLSQDGSSLGIELEFTSMDDFGPERVAQSVEPIRKLVEARKRLNEVALKVNSSGKLDQMLENVLKSTEALKQLSDEAAKKPSGEGDNG